MARLRFRLLFPALIVLAAGPAAAEIELISRVPYPAGATQPGTTEAIGRRSLSADGRFAVFATSATAVLPGVVDLNGQLDIYLQDRTTSNFELISHAPGAPLMTGETAAFEPMISTDGRYVVFRVSNSLNTAFSVYRYDRVSGERQLISHQRGQPAQILPGYNYNLGISGDGRFVVMTSTADASLLVENISDQNQSFLSSSWDLFLWDAVTDTFQLISHLAEDVLSTPNGSSTTETRDVEVADDGKVAFRSSRLLTPQGGSSPTMYLFDPQTGINHIVSRSMSSPTVPAAASVSAFCDVSPNARYVLFTHPGTDLIAGLTDTNAADDLFLFDGDSGTLELISNVHLDPATAGNGVSGCGKISSDGRFVSFTSTAANLAPGTHPTSGADLFRKDRQTNLAELLSGRATDPLEATGLTLPLRETVSEDGLAVFFDSTSTTLVTGATLGGGGPWSYQWEADSVLLGAPGVGGSTTTFTTETQALSADGSRAILTTPMPTELTGAPHVAIDAAIQPVLYEAGELAVTLALPAAFAATGSPTRGMNIYAQTNIGHGLAIVSEDGSKVAFLTDSNEICGTGQPLCLLDRASTTFSNVKHLPQNPNTFFADATFPLEISQDGRWLLIESMSPNIAAVDTNNNWDIFLYDTENRTFTVVSHAVSSAATTGNQQSTQERNGSKGMMTPAGDQIVFSSRATDLVAGASVSNSQVYLYSMQTGELRLVSHRFGNLLQGGDGPSFRPVIAAGGGHVVFASSTTNLIDGGLVPIPGGLSDLFRYDLATGQMDLISFRAINPRRGVRSSLYRFFVSTDGRFVLHANNSPLLFAGTDTNNSTDIFLYDHSTKTNTLLTHAHDQLMETSNGTDTSLVGMSSDGRFAVFRSNATNILPGVSGDQVYLWDRLDGSRRLVSHRQGNANQPLTGVGFWASLSPDGAKLLFSATDSNVIPGLIDTNSAPDYFSWDRASDQLELVTPRWSRPGEAGGGNCQLDFGDRPPSTRGEFQLLWCRDAALTGFDNNSGYDLFLLHRSALFADGFESGSTAAWSLTVP